MERANYPLWVLCKVLQVTRQGFQAWLSRGESKRAREDAILVERIRYYHKKGRQAYGSPRILDDLRGEGFDVGLRRVARLMRTHGIVGLPEKKYRVTTNSGHDFPIAPNILRRQFMMSAPNEAWVTDITYIRTWEGWLYLTVILDLFSRRVVGWSVSTHMRQEIVLDALEMALGRRLPPEGLIVHSDRGIQFASDAHRKMLKANGIVLSMSRKGDCWDNAVAESFFATLKRELIYRYTWRTRAMAKSAIIEYIEMFYNSYRRHSFIGNVSPMEFERRFEPPRLFRRLFVLSQAASA